jgi:hypothetical protein
MRLPPTHWSSRARGALLCTIFLVAIANRAIASGEQWAEAFKTPFSSPIVATANDLRPPTLPTATSAMLATVAGLNVGDSIKVDGIDNVAHDAVVTQVDPATPWSRGPNPMASRRS